jgi:hypothetical protein
MPRSTSARVFIALIVISGLCVLGDAILSAQSIYVLRFVSFLVVACIASRLRLKLPGVTGSMSVNLPFILVAVAEMSSLEALAVGCISTFVQCIPSRPKKLNVTQALFNFSNMALAVAATRLMFQSAAASSVVSAAPLRLSMAGGVFFLVNSVPVAIVIALAEAVNAVRTWLGMFQLSFPYFLASAAVSGLVLNLSNHIGWQVPVAVMPLMLAVFQSYRRLLGVVKAPPFSTDPNTASAVMRANA